MVTLIPDFCPLWPTILWMYVCMYICYMYVYIYVYMCMYIWYLKGSLMENVTQMELLGVTFQCNGTSNSHVDNRIGNCRRSYYGLSGKGMCYPGLCSEAKSHIWKTVCSPVLTYGLECVHINKTGINKMESMQGRCIKEAMGIPNRSHHSDLLTALGISKVYNIVAKNSANLWRRIFKVDSMAADLNRYLLSVFLRDGAVYPNTLLGRLISFGLDPIRCAVTKTNIADKYRQGESGVIESLQHLLVSENFIKPWSAEHSLVTLLTSCF